METDFREPKNIHDELLTTRRELCSLGIHAEMGEFGETPILETAVGNIVYYSSTARYALYHNTHRTEVRRPFKTQEELLAFLDKIYA